MAGLGGDADRSIVEAVLALAHGLRIGVVAEGIETEAQRARLVELGCTLGQGYLFSTPVPAADAGRLLRPRRSSRTVKPCAATAFVAADPRQAVAPGPAVRPGRRGGGA